MGAGTLGYFPLLRHFRNHEFKSTGLIQFFLSLLAILTALLLVCTLTQPDTSRLDYDLFSVRCYQIRMYFIPSRIYTIELPSLASVYIYHRLETWCLIIKHKSRNKRYVPRCGILSYFFVGAFMWIFALRKNKI